MIERVHFIKSTSGYSTSRYETLTAIPINTKKKKYFYVAYMNLPIPHQSNAIKFPQLLKQKQQCS